MNLKDKKVMSIASAALCLVAVISFFLPFIVVSVSVLGQSQADSQSGFKVLFELFSKDLFDGEGTVMSIWAIVAFLSAVAGIVFSLELVPLHVKGEGLQIAGICGVISAVTLLLGSIALNSMVRSGVDGLGSMVRVGMTGAGWWIAFIASVLAACAAFYGYSLSKKETPPIVY